MTLLRGSTGVDVVAIQNRLRALGWALTADGAFGLDTDAAVRQQQRLLGLEPDGIVGPVTTAALASAPAGPSNRTPVRRRPDPAIRYRSQRDNVHLPSSTCNVTSYAMLLSALGVEEPVGQQLEDALYERIVSPEGMAEFRRSSPSLVGRVAPQTVHAMLVWVASQWGRKTRFTTQARWADVIAELAAGTPVVLAGKFTASGHIVCAVGLASQSDLVVHDPWGDWNRGYRSTDGAARIYTLESLAGITRGDGEVWAHFVA